MILALCLKVEAMAHDAGAGYLVGIVATSHRATMTVAAGVDIWNQYIVPPALGFSAQRGLNDRAPEVAKMGDGDPGGAA